eukprot:3375935-Rhodomonas_salina.4
MSGTDLCDCYAMSGTGMGDMLPCCAFNKRSGTGVGVVLRTGYATSGTDIEQRAIPGRNGQ